MRRLAVFARWPEPGRVKTRLSPALPVALACDLHRAMVEDALALARTAEADERLVYWSDPPAAGAADLTPPGFTSRAQIGADLGERLERAFAELLPEHADRAVVIGSDCPDLDAATVNAAFRALESHAAVLGPARDGGYYLIGLARPVPELFRGIAWSAPTVLEQTEAHLRGRELSYLRLPARDDVDVPADLVRWIGRLAAGEAERGTRAAAALAAMGLLGAPATPRGEG